MKAIRKFMERHFRHFNARETVAAAKGWKTLIDDGGQMFVTLAGAMSSAELGISLAPMIRAGKVSAICSTAANLEEDIFNLLENNSYKVLPNYRDLSPQDERALYEQGWNRVTDTCIPEAVMRNVEGVLIEAWAEAAAHGVSKFPYEYIYEFLDRPGIEDLFQIPREDSWVLAAKEMGLPIYTPGYEDSTLGNIFTARVLDGTIASHSAIRTGTEQLAHLAAWYQGRVDRKIPVGFFQIGGGIAGDFSICVVPMLIQDLKRDVPFWAYFAQIGDSTTSYGSYSGAVPNEKITWGKLDAETPKFMINSDASIVAPLIFAYVLADADEQT
jgi:deoxyhypusine synthase